jgi:hypothetical protein
MTEKAKAWWSDDGKWFCLLVNDGVNQATVSLTPEEAVALVGACVKTSDAQQPRLRAALEQIAVVCTDNMDRDCDHRMALDFVRQVANDGLGSVTSTHRPGWQEYAALEIVKQAVSDLAGLSGEISGVTSEKMKKLVSVAQTNRDGLSDDERAARAIALADAHAREKREGGGDRGEK